MVNFAAKYSIMTQEMVDSFCDSFYIPAEVHPTAPGRDKTITQFPVGKVGVYSRLFDVCGYRIPFTKNFMAVLKYFRVHISQLSPFGAARVSHFEVLTRVLDLSPSVTVFRAFYTRTYSDGLFSFAKRSTSAPSCFPKPPDSIKNWADHFFWVDSCVFPISVPLYTGGVLEKDSAPHLTARQEQTVKLLENSYALWTADPRKVWAVEVQKGDDQFCCGREDHPYSTEARQKEDVAEEDAYLELADPDEGTAMVRQSEEEVVTEQSKKVKKRRLQKQSDVLPAKKLRTDHPALASGAGGKTLAVWNRLGRGSRLPDREQFVFPSVAPPSQESEGFLDSSARTNLRICTTILICCLPRLHGAAATTKLDKRCESDLAVLPPEGRKGLLEEEVKRSLKLKSNWGEEAEAQRLSAFVDQFVIVEGKSALAAGRCSAQKLFVSSLRAGFQDFKEMMAFSRNSRPRSCTTEALIMGYRLALLKCLKSPEYQGTLGHALGRAAPKARYVDAVKALDDVDFSLVSLLKSKKDDVMDELSVPIHHAGDTTAIGETSLSFALMNVHARAEGAKKHAAALRQLMIDIVSALLSSQTWMGEASTFVAPLSVEDYDEEDTDEASGSVVVVHKFETYHF
ncbi:hypothetical protein Tco_1507597 [Tanacetum coccineum]